MCPVLIDALQLFSEIVFFHFFLMVVFYPPLPRKFTTFFS